MIPIQPLRQMTAVLLSRQLIIPQTRLLHQTQLQPRRRYHQHHLLQLIRLQQPPIVSKLQLTIARTAQQRIARLTKLIQMPKTPTTLTAR